MVQAETAERKFKDGDENFPILFEDDRVRVYKNPAGEIFVEILRNEDSTIRVTPDLEGFYITAHNATITPWAVRGLPAFCVLGKKR